MSFFCFQNSSLCSSVIPLPTFTLINLPVSVPSQTNAPKVPSYFPVPSSTSFTSSDTSIKGFIFNIKALLLHSYNPSGSLIITPSKPFSKAVLFICANFF